jgi:hypothetical protein
MPCPRCGAGKVEGIRVWGRSATKLRQRYGGRSRWYKQTGAEEWRLLAQVLSVVYRGTTDHWFLKGCDTVIP